jgi:hypothetical protein
VAPIIVGVGSHVRYGTKRTASIAAMMSATDPTYGPAVHRKRFSAMVGWSCANVSGLLVELSSGP